MIPRHSKGGRLTKMEDKVNCEKCGKKISEEEMFFRQGICPVCGGRDWVSDPVFVGFDDD